MAKNNVQSVSARKSSNHKLSPNHKISPDTNLHITYTIIKHNIFKELVPLATITKKWIITLLFDPKVKKYYGLLFSKHRIKTIPTHQKLLTHSSKTNPATSGHSLVMQTLLHGATTTANGVKKEGSSFHMQQVRQGNSHQMRHFEDENQLETFKLIKTSWLHAILAYFSGQHLLQETWSEVASSLENLENVQMFPSAGFVGLFYHNTQKMY